MADLVDELRGQRDSYSVRLSNLLIEYEKNPETLFLVFEGEDIKYYGIRIKGLFVDNERMTVPCKGKQDVIRLYFRVLGDVKLTSIKIMYFVDRDFDDNSLIMGRENIYVTPGYSVENLYVEECCLKEILQAEFGLCAFKDGDVLTKIVDIYRAMMIGFLEAITLLNVWIMEQRVMEAGQRKLNLNNVKLDKFISISLGEVSARYKYEDLSGLFPEAGEVDEDLVHKRISEMSGADKLSLFRGKYLIEFFRFFIQALKVDRSSVSPQYFPYRANTKVSDP